MSLGNRHALVHQASGARRSQIAHLITGALPSGRKTPGWTARASLGTGSDQTTWLGNLHPLTEEQRRELSRDILVDPLGDPERWHHPLLLVRLGSHFVRYLEPNFHRVALARVNAVQGHLLPHAILLLRSDVSAGLRPELQRVGLEWVSKRYAGVRSKNVRNYLFYGDLEVQLPNRLAGRIGEDSLKGDLAWRGLYPPSDKVDSHF